MFKEESSSYKRVAFPVFTGILTQKVGHPQVALFQALIILILNVNVVI